MNDEIIAFIREHPDGITSQAIAERFLKFKNPNKALAETAVSAILSKDARARRSSCDGGLWTARATAGRGDGPDGTDISEIP
jgi:hypothetical protein